MPTVEEFKFGLYEDLHTECEAIVEGTATFSDMEDSVWTDMSSFRQQFIETDDPRFSDEWQSYEAVREQLAAMEGQVDEWAEQSNYSMGNRKKMFTDGTVHIQVGWNSSDHTDWMPYSDFLVAYGEELQQTASGDEFIEALKDDGIYELKRGHYKPDSLYRGIWQDMNELYEDEFGTWLEKHNMLWTELQSRADGLMDTVERKMEQELLEPNQDTLYDDMPDYAA